MHLVHAEDVPAGEPEFLKSTLCSNTLADALAERSRVDLGGFCAPLNEVDMSVMSRLSFILASALDPLEHLDGGAHHSSSFLHRSNAILVHCRHAKGAHVENNGTDLGMHEQLVHLVHLPGLRPRGVFMDEVSAGSELKTIYFDTEPDMALGYVELSLDGPRVPLVAADGL